MPLIHGFVFATDSPICLLPLIHGFVFEGRKIRKFGVGNVHLVINIRNLKDIDLKLDFKIEAD